MNAREQAIVILVATMHDGLPDPAGKRTFEARRTTLSGESASTWRDCRPCHGRGGRPGPGGDWVVCDRCEGKGRELIDGYTLQTRDEMQAEPADSKTRAAASSVRDTELERLEMILEDEDDSGEERWLEKRLLLDRAGSYRELRRALHEMPVPLHTAVSVVYGDHPLRAYWNCPGTGELPAAVVVTAGLGVKWLSSRMPARVRVPHWLRDDDAARAHRERDGKRRAA